MPDFRAGLPAMLTALSLVLAPALAGSALAQGSFDLGPPAADDAATDTDTEADANADTAPLPGQVTDAEMPGQKVETEMPGTGDTVAESDEAVTPPPPPGPPPPPPEPTPPPPPPPPPEMAVYIAVNGATTGPFTRPELEAKAGSGELTGATMVWQDGMAEWQKASTVDAVQSILTSAEPSLDAGKYVLGTWRSTDVNVPIPGVPGGGLLNGTTTYKPDGTVAMQGTITWSQPNPNMPGQMIPVTVSLSGQGSYGVQPIDDARFIINPQISLEMTVPGMPPETEYLAEPIIMNVIDENTTRDGEGAVSRRVK